MAAWQWVSVDLRTGALIADLPALEVDWPLRRSISLYDTGTAHLPWVNAPENWLRATQPGASVLIGYDENDPLHRPLWGGRVVTRTRNTTKDVADLTLSTIEGYFDRRYVKDITYTQISQSQILKDLVERYAKEGALPGIPITVVKLDEGMLRDRQYFDVDDVTLYQRINELTGVIGGPEYVVEWDWSTDLQFIKPTLTVGSRIGIAAVGSAPTANFELGGPSAPGTVTEAEIVEDYSAGAGANDVTALSSGQGAARPTSGPQRVTDYKGLPTYEFRWTPSTSITVIATLVDYAKQALAVMSDGSTSAAFTAQIGPANRFRTDWNIGDDVAYTLEHPLMPGSITGVARAIGANLYAEQIAPILAVDDVT